MRRALALLLLGCHPVQPFEPPPPPSEEVRSAIVAFETDEELEVFALDLVESDPLTRPFAADADASITLLYLPHDLASMQLAPGKIPASAGPPERSLPQFIAAYQTIDEGDVLAWTQIAELSGRLAEFRLRGFAVEECASLGGCYLDREQSELEDCSVPCPTTMPALPERPVPPLLPSFEPCPEGWISRTLDTVVVCEPSLCPPGQYAVDLPPGAILVDPTETTLRAAIATASPGSTIGLAKGVHRGSTTIDRAVKIVGACASETIIELSPDEVGVIAGADLELSDLTIRGGMSPLEVVAGTTTLSRVVIGGSTGGALTVSDASLAARDLIVRDSNGGIDTFGATVDLARVLVERAAPYGSRIQSSTITAEDVVIGASGTAVEVLDSGLVLSRASLLDAEGTGVRVLGESRFTAQDLSIARVFRPAGYAAGLELSLSNAEIERFAASEIDGESVRVGGTTMATLRDVTIARDGGTPDPFGTQCGLDVFGKANVTIERIRLEQLFRQGLCSNGEATVSASDVTAIDVGDHGLYVFTDASLTVRRAEIEGAADGVVAFLRTTLDVEDLTVRRMHGDVRYVPMTMLGYPRGRGIYNNAMARVRVERFVVSECEDAGLDLGSRDSVSLSDGVVTDNQIGARITFEPKHLIQKLRVSGNRLNFAAE